MLQNPYFILLLKSIIVLEFRRVENSLNTEFYRKHWIRFNVYFGPLKMQILL